MKYIMIPYFVGCIYEGGSTEYLRLAVEDEDVFLLDMMHTMDDLLSVMNKKEKHPWPDFVIAGHNLPHDSFFYFDKKNEKWAYEEPSFEFFPGEDFMVIELGYYGFSHYHFVQSTSKESLVEEMERAYQQAIDNPLSRHIYVKDKTFDSADLVTYERSFDRKGRSEGYHPYPNLRDIYTKEEWFA